MVAAKLCLVLGGRGWWQQNNDWSWVVVDGGVKLWLVVGGGGKIMVARGCWRQNYGCRGWSRMVVQFSNVCF